MPHSKPIFVAATRQHVGKTTVALAIMSGLRKRFRRVGFIKPVGQQHVTVADEKSGKQIRVDKDVEVLKEFFNLSHVDYSTMSPVIIPKGYTSKYIDGEMTSEDQENAIRGAFARQNEDSDIVLVEGTGHTGVGSVVEMSNARAASLVSADVVLVANGGLGKAFDELEMNRQMFEREGVAVRGVVLNKVIPDKVEMVREKMGKLLRQRWGVPLLGVVPDLPFLGEASLGELEKALGGELLAGGERARALHFTKDDAFLVTTGLRRFLRRAFIDGRTTSPLFIAHATRDDLLLGYLAHWQRAGPRGSDWPGDWAGAFVLSTGASRAFPDPFAPAEDLELSTYLKRMAADTDAPVLVTPMGPVDALEAIKGYTAKHNTDNFDRVRAAINHYEPAIDFDLLLDGQSTGY